MALLSDIDDVKKKLARMEEDTRFKLKQLEESFALFRDVIIQMQKEKSELERRNLLLEKEKKLLVEKKQLAKPLHSLAGKVDERIVKPAKAEFEDTMNLAKEILKEDLEPSKEEINYIEIPEPKTREKEKPDYTKQADPKKRALKWLRERYGIDKEEKKEKAAAKKRRRIIAS